MENLWGGRVVARFSGNPFSHASVSRVASQRRSQLLGDEHHRRYGPERLLAVSFRLWLPGYDNSHAFRAIG